MGGNQRIVPGENLQYRWKVLDPSRIWTTPFLPGHFYFPSTVSPSLATYYRLYLISFFNLHCAWIKLSQLQQTKHKLSLWWRIWLEPVASSLHRADHQTKGCNKWTAALPSPVLLSPQSSEGNTAVGQDTSGTVTHAQHLGVFFSAQIWQWVRVDRSSSCQADLLSFQLRKADANRRPRCGASLMCSTGSFFHHYFCREYESIKGFQQRDLAPAVSKKLSQRKPLLSNILQRVLYCQNLSQIWPMNHLKLPLCYICWFTGKFRIV